MNKKYDGMLCGCGTEEEIIKAVKLIDDNCKMAVISIDYTRTIYCPIDWEGSLAYFDYVTLQQQYDRFYTTYESESRVFLGWLGIPLLIQPINSSDSLKSIAISLQNTVNDLGEFMPRFYNKTVDGFDPIEGDKQGVMITGVYDDENKQGVTITEVYDDEDNKRVTITEFDDEK